MNSQWTGVLEGGKLLASVPWTQPSAGINTQEGRNAKVLLPILPLWIHALTLGVRCENAHLRGEAMEAQVMRRLAQASQLVGGKGAGWDPGEAGPLGLPEALPCTTGPSPGRSEYKTFLGSHQPKAGLPLLPPMGVLPCLSTCFLFSLQKARPGWGLEAVKVKGVIYELSCSSSSKNRSWACSVQMELSGHLGTVGEARWIKLSGPGWRLQRRTRRAMWPLPMSAPLWASGLPSVTGWQDGVIPQRPAAGTGEDASRSLGRARLVAWLWADSTGLETLETEASHSFFLASHVHGPYRKFWFGV